MLRSETDELGDELRRLRIEVGMRAKDLADAVGMSRSKMSKIERGHQQPLESDVMAIASALKIPGETAEHLLQKARGLRRQSHAATRFEIDAVSMRDLDVYLQNATNICWFENVILPGLLQLPEYAQQVTSASGFFRSAEGIEHIVISRLRRQSELYSSAKRFSFVFSLASLLSLPLSDELMERQYRKILEVSELPNVDIRVISTPHYIPCNGYVIYDDDLVVEEHLLRGVSIRDTKMIELSRQSFEIMREAAFDQDQTVQLLEDLIEGKPTSLI